MVLSGVTALSSKTAANSAALFNEPSPSRRAKDARVAYTFKHAEPLR